MLSGWVSPKWPEGKSCSCCSSKGTDGNTGKWRIWHWLGEGKWPTEASERTRLFLSFGGAIEASCRYSSLEAVSVDRWRVAPGCPEAGAFPRDSRNVLAKANRPHCRNSAGPCPNPSSVSFESFGNG
uniref:Uncharacterized protein n=1 Tax=Molossus molossus TaxID=27622 RepID=A0A7J8CZ89_MOLMO|nr:hypothetical protein HJG59_009466 [Molossus molossus]